MRKMSLFFVDVLGEILGGPPGKPNTPYLLVDNLVVDLFSRKVIFVIEAHPAISLITRIVL
jgi:hypothetical protein